MSDPSFEQFFKSIVAQESGGNYGATGTMVKGDRAYGKYQVMGNNIPGWTKQYLGKALTPMQYLNNPAAQDAVARGRLKQYYDKYGARGAAAAWYSGNPHLDMSTGPQPGGPSIKTYVDSVINRAYGLSGGAGGGGGAGGSLERVVPMTRAETAESYGFVQSMLDAIPDLKKIFNQAVKAGWTAAKFQASIRDTNWFKTHSQQERDFLVTQYGDPKTAAQKLANAKTKARVLSAQMGVQYSKGYEAWLNQFAYGIVAKGWSDADLRYQVAQHITFWGGNHEGEAGEAYNKLSTFSYSMGIKNSDAWYLDAARRIVQGTQTEQDFEDQMRKSAKTLFPQWAKQIDSGQTVADIASPYFQSMSTILEIPPGGVNLFDPTIKKALQYKDPKTGANSVKPIWQFETELRSDSRWKSTKNAQDSMMQAAHQVLSDFGVKY